MTMIDNRVLKAPMADRLVTNSAVTEAKPIE